MEKKKQSISDLEMAKKRNRKIMITEEAINKVPRIEYREIPEEEYDNIWMLVKNVLQISKDQNDSNEVAITYNMDIEEKDDDISIGVSLGLEHSVDPLDDTDSFHIVYSAKNCVVIVLHNHPSLSDFSLLDIQFLLTYAAVKMMVVVTNLGSEFYLIKQEKYDRSKAVALFDEAIQMNNSAKNLKDIQKAADHFLKNCYNVGIIYGNH